MRARSLLVVGVLAAWPALPMPRSGDSPAVTAHRGALLQVGKRSFALLGESVVEVGRTSFYCLSCHDGTVAREAFPVSRTGAEPAPPGVGRGHPVDVRYPLSNARFRPAGGLDSRLVLIDGCVSCVTCHGGADPSNKRLSVPNDRSALCLSCHVK